MIASEQLPALESGLAIEDQIIYGYGVLGAHLPESLQPQLTSVWDAHRTRRDELAKLIRSLGGQAAGPLPAYRLPFAVTDPASARRLAARLEAAGTGAAWAIVAASSPATQGRDLGISWLMAGARNEVLIGRAIPPALPGRRRPR